MRTNSVVAALVATVGLALCLAVSGGGHQISESEARSVFGGTCDAKAAKLCYDPDALDCSSTLLIKDHDQPGSDKDWNELITRCVIHETCTIKGYRYLGDCTGGK